MINVQVVSFHCVLKNKLGKVISSTFNKDVLTSAPTPQEQLQALSKGLQNLTKGEKRKIVLSAGEAYGFYDVSKVLELSGHDLRGAEKLKVGEKVFYSVQGEKAQLYRVSRIYGDQITLDGNHPLAGQDLVFEIEATEVRDATDDEIREAQEVSSGDLLH
ncbi:FKBP-type peptidyl-prolyl cis-trans isomerase [Bdellovibrio sp. HCB2-146]|uniref:FKBP-type peptidyl-prolyl cis-trans isomerase n=1 Tax=Bdellovibrio sp. HCB2-146 TaxID=3394362 RepID=UPI0039BC65BD